MGLIRRQMGVDLETKIRDWLEKSNLLLDITDDLKLLVPNSTREVLIQMILYLSIKESQELPEYILFDFSQCDYCAHIYLCGYIDDALQLFNKADKHLFGINECRIHCCSKSKVALYDLKRIGNEWCCVKEVLI